jgi:undecaprenyl-diphosphatase
MSLLILIGLFIGYPYLHALDQGVMTLVQEHRSRCSMNCGDFTLIGEFRNMLMFSALLTGLLLLCRQWRPAIFAGGTLLCTALANTVTKQFFARVRPEVLTDPLTSYSMPSGHASGSFALFLVLAVLAGRGQPPRMRLTWLLLGCIPALSIALSRVYLGAHWPTDILAGRCWRHACARGPVAESAQGAAQRHAVQGLVAGRRWWRCLHSS